MLQVRTLNKRMVAAEAHEDDKSAQNSLLRTLETQLINASSELVSVCTAHYNHAISIIALSF